EACHHPVAGSASDRQASRERRVHVAWPSIRFALHPLLERSGRGRVQGTQHAHRCPGNGASLSFIPVASALAETVVRNPAILRAPKSDIVERSVLRYTQRGEHASRV